MKIREIPLPVSDKNSKINRYADRQMYSFDLALCYSLVLYKTFAGFEYTRNKWKLIQERVTPTSKVANHNIAQR